MESVNRIVSAAVGVSCAEIVTLPICTVKTIYQVENVSVKDCVSKIKNNPLVLFKASIPAVLSQIYTSVYKFTIFNYFQQFFEKTWQLLLLGSCVSVSSLVVTHPLDYIRVSYQTNQKMVLKECFKGISPNTMKQTIAGAAYLPVRQSIKNNFPELKSWQAGVIAAFIGTSLVHPFDYFKTYLLGNAVGTKVNFSRPFRGLHLNLMRVIPHFVIMTEMSDYFYSKIV